MEQSRVLCCLQGLSQTETVKQNVIFLGPNSLLKIYFRLRLHRMGTLQQEELLII